MIFRLFLEDVGELVGHVDCHGAHPQIEADQSVLVDVTKKHTEPVQMFNAVVDTDEEMNTVLDAKEEVADKNVEKKTNGDFSKDILAQFREDGKDNESEKDEEAGYEDGNWVKDAGKAGLLLLLGLHAILADEQLGLDCSWAEAVPQIQLRQNMAGGNSSTIVSLFRLEYIT